MNIMYAVI